jgi:hypothetical protein
MLGIRIFKEYLPSIQTQVTLIFETRLIIDWRVIDAARTLANSLVRKEPANISL